MSSTNRGTNKVPHDAYMTPHEPITSLINVLNWSMVQAYGFLEPCRGTGNIYNAIDAGWKQHAEISEGIDYLTTPFENVDITITNPTFSLALEFLEKSLDESTSVIYLLRVNFLGSQKRKAFWQENRPTHLLTLSQRPKFAWACKTKGCGHTYPPETKICDHCGGKVAASSDSCEYAWFCWDRIGIVDLPAGIHVL